MPRKKHKLKRKKEKHEKGCTSSRIIATTLFFGKMGNTNNGAASKYVQIGNHKRGPMAIAPAEISQNVTRKVGWQSFLKRLKMHPVLLSETFSSQGKKLI